MLFRALSDGTTTLSCIVNSDFPASRSFKTDVALTLIDLKTSIPFKFKDLTAFTHSDGESKSF